MLNLNFKSWKLTTIQELDDYKVEMSLNDAKEWLESNLIPPYWVEEADARSNIHSKFYY